MKSANRKSPITVKKVIALSNFRLFITFEDNVSKIVDFTKLPLKGIYKKLQIDKKLFETVSIEDGEPIWKGNIIFDPDDLYAAGEITDTILVSAST